MIDGFQKLSKHTTIAEVFEPSDLKEISSRGARPQWFISKSILQRIDEIRDHFGKPVIIHSGRRFGKNPYSQHEQGKAIDFHISGVNCKDVLDFCLKTYKSGAVGVGYNNDFVHIDDRDENRETKISAGIMLLKYNSIGQAYSSVEY